MARKHIGKLSWGGVIALCAVLLLAPETRSQIIVKPTKIKYVISGSVGISGVTMQGLPVTPAPITDENGIYSVNVEHGWGGTVKPVKIGYTFDPVERSYQKVTSSMPNEDYTANMLTFTISGSVGLPGVKMTGLPGEPISDASGRYTATVEYGWSGAATPEKMGYRFEPSTRMYSQVTKDETTSYKYAELKVTISGSAGVGGVVMKGLPGDPTTKGDGTYSAQVGYAWDGKVTPTKEGHQFTPEYREYSVVTENMTNEDYQVQVFTYEISGSTGLAGVVMKGLPDEPVTDADGFYTAVVQHGWSGKVTPDKAGYQFDPAMKEYTKVVTDYRDENYNPSRIYLTISGRTGTGNVTLEGLPGDPTSDAAGDYSAKVEYGWYGSVAPTKEGWAFEPEIYTFDSITQNQKQDYKAQPVTYEISGNVGQSGVVLRGLPKSPVSGPDGSYKDEVSWNWRGTVTPTKAGYTFEPEKREYVDVLSSLPGEDYTPNVIQYTISGRVTGEEGPLAEVLVFGEGIPSLEGPVSTDANGEFQMEVPHGWRGRLSPKSDRYEFSPLAKPFDAVVQNVANQNFTAKIKTVTITNKIGYGEGADFEPIADVTLTAAPGGQKAVTGRDGKYTIRVPYGWTGELQLYKEGFAFDPNSIAFANVTESIDGTKTPPPPPPPARTPGEAPGQIPGQAPGQIPGQAPGQIPGQLPTPNEQLLQQIAQVQQQLRTAQDQQLAARLRGDQAPPQLQQTISQLQQQLNILLAMAGVQTGETATLPSFPVVDTTQAALLTPNLIDVLMALSQQTGVKIGIDATVKPVPVSVGFNMANLTAADVPTALGRILQNTEYKFQMVGSNTYLVYKAVTQLFQGDDLRQALQDLSSTAGVPIAADPNVFGNVYADIREQPVEKALEIMLAGTPYVIQKKPNYILVADRSLGGAAFPEISETRVFRTNYKTPERILSLLSPTFAQYVKSEPVDLGDPNDRGHALMITAPPDIADRIVADIRRVDTRPRQVLLTARVVIMERGDLLNLGVQWGFPTIRAGSLLDSTLQAVDDVADTAMTGIQIGYTPTREFTDSLLAAINLLKENSQLNILSSPQILAQDGRESQLRQVTEEWFFMSAPANAFFGFANAELQKIESGTVLTITPYVGDNNDITLKMAIEVSDSIPRGRGSDLPVVNRRVAKNSVTVEDGGTVALAGLTENRARSKDSRVPGLSNVPLIGPLFRNEDNDKVNREIAVFVTAHLVRDDQEMMFRTPTAAPAAMRMPEFPSATGGAWGPQPPPARTGLTRADLEEALARQNR